MLGKAECLLRTIVPSAPLTLPEKKWRSRELGTRRKIPREASAEVDVVSTSESQVGLLPGNVNC